MRTTARGIALLALVLSACQIGPACGCTPVPLPSGRLEPQKITLGGAVTTYTNTETSVATTSTSSSAIVLVGGHLPANTFTAQRDGLIAQVNASGLTPAQKSSFIASVSTAFADLEAYVNAKLDSVPRRMSIVPNPPLGGSFTFTPSNAPAFTLSGLYNPSTTEFRIVNVSAVGSASNQYAVLFGFAATDFIGAMTQPSAILTAGALGNLTITDGSTNIGLVGISVNLTLELGFTRD